MNQAAILEREFLPLRAKLLEVAATLDRLDRAEAPAVGDERVRQLYVALRTLLDEPGGDRAEQIQLLFSRPYEDDWWEELQMANDE